MNTRHLLPLVVIAGPTASGKSALASALADLTPSVIINADSMQVYSDLRIVTARPGMEEESRHPHRLYGYIDGSEACSAARWAQDAKSAIAESHALDRLPILVGGTGLYIRTLLNGIAPVPDIDPNIRQQVRDLSVVDAYAALTTEDPMATARLSPNDSARIARALEVVRSTGRPIHDWQGQKVGGIGDAVRLVPQLVLPPRDWLWARCDQRFDIIFDEGREEVDALMARGLDPELPVMRAIGVTEIASVSHRSDAKEAGKLATRQYAKRQYTWFRRQVPETWPIQDASLDSDLIHKLAIKLQSNALTG